MKHWLVLTIIGLAFLIPNGANAGMKDDCVKKEGNTQIRGCTKVIKSGRWTGENLAWAYNNRGNGYRDLNNDADALKDYSKAISLKKGYYLGHYNRGRIYLKRKKYVEARSEFETAIKSKPDYARSYNELGRVYLRLKDHNQAVVEFNRAIAVDDKLKYAYLNRGLAYSRMGNIEQAIRDYEKTITLDPKYVIARNNLGYAYYKLGDYNRAIEYYDQAIALDPSYKRAVTNRKAATKKLAELGTTKLAALPPKKETPQIKPEPVVNLDEKRVALVIGNSSYTNVPVLSNPRNDATSVADALQRLGFTVVRSEFDLNYPDMLRTLSEFADLAANSDWAVIYYAGHGIEKAGKNYLIPVDASLKTDRHVEFEALDLSRVLNAVEGASSLKMVILDACRDNPFANKIISTGKTRSIGRGLSRVEPDAGILVAYAAREGSVALDGEGNNSPFASALVEHLETPGLEVGRLFRKIRAKVLKQTNGAQEPIVYGALPDRDLFFSR